MSPKLGCWEFRQLFLAHYHIASDENSCLADKVDSLGWLAAQISNPDEALLGIGEMYRKGGPGLWCRLLMDKYAPKNWFSFEEMASFAAVSVDRVRRPYLDRFCVDPMHPNVADAILHHLDIPRSEWPMAPTDLQWDIAGICHAAPKLFDLLERSDRSNGKRKHGSMKYPVGLVMHELVTHNRLDAIEFLLPRVQVSRADITGCWQVMDVLSECVDRANANLAEYPRMHKTFGTIVLEVILDELASALLYLESWFFCRELLVDTLKGDEKLFGIFA